MGELKDGAVVSLVRRIDEAIAQVKRVHTRKRASSD